MDTKGHQDLLRRVALNVSLQEEEVMEESDRMVDILAPEGPSGVALPLVRTSKTPQRCFGKLPPLYHLPLKVWKDDILCHRKGMNTFSPTPNRGLWWSMRQGQPGPAPKSRDAKRLDLFGRKVYSTVGLQL